MTDRFYITTPIYYVNAEPHLGHLYATMLADTVCRFNRQRGRETYFLTGTDEHSQKIERAAEAKGIPVQAFVDGLAGRFRGVFDHWKIGYDQFIRTTSDVHKAGAQELWRRCRDAGLIYKSVYAGWYCVQDNAFIDGPKEGPPPECPDSGGPAEWVEEESYFFRLSAFQDRLLAHYREHPEFIQPESRRNEIVSFVSGGLQDLSISRVTTTWGVQVPDDPAHVMYVWFDALSNYITALGFGTSPDEDRWKFWPGVHLIGKDILRFHTVYWPAFLMGAGLPLPQKVMVHGLWMSGGRKMSKRLGNGVDIGLLDRHFSHDAVRYYCLAEMAFGQDGDFTYGALVDRANADLANGIGNLASRTLTMLAKYFDGVLPSAEVDASVRASVGGAVVAAVGDFEGFEFRRGIESIRAAMAVVDRYISDTKPWAIAKDSSRRDELAAVLVTAFEALRAFVVILAPALPEGSTAIWRSMNLDGLPSDVDPGTLELGAVPAGHRIGEVAPVFPRLNKEQIMDDISKETAVEGAPAPEAATPQAAAAPAPEPVKAEPDYITIDDFAKVELRVGQVLAADRIEGADKLLKLSVDLGEAEPRQVLAGIAMHYAPETLIGRKIVVCSNLKPRKMRGLESQGMILAASVGDDGVPVLATFTEDVPNGVRLK